MNLSKHIYWRKGLLTALNGFSFSEATRTIEQLTSVLGELREIKEQLPSDSKPVIAIMESLVQSFISLCNWVNASLNGEEQADRFLKAAQMQTSIASESLASTRFSVFSKAAQNPVNMIREIKNFEDVKDVALQLQLVPIPLFLMTEGRSRAPRDIGEDRSRHKLSYIGPLVVKIMFEVDRKPLSTPQILRVNTIYDLGAKVTISKWPEGSDFLLIDYITTLDKSLYRITPLRIERPIEHSREFSLKGQVEFPVSQSILSEPLIIKTRATFGSQVGKEFPARIIGYDELRVKISDKERTPLLARYRSIDIRNEEIIKEVDNTFPNVDTDHRNDFIEALGAVTNYLGICLQQALYNEKSSVKESVFHKDLLRHMRIWLGEDVKEAPKQGGGPTDIQYRTVTLELKVEKEISDRKKMIGKYLAQPTQYSSAGGAQLGILCILDLTEKQNPPATPQNNITLETPIIHGFSDAQPPFPTKIAAVIIDGNLRTPSSYSRKSKTRRS